MDILSIISRMPLTASSLSNELRISSPTTSYYLRKLTNADVIHVELSIEDLRRKTLTLSDRGRALLFMYENDILFHPMVMDVQHHVPPRP